MSSSKPLYDVAGIGRAYIDVIAPASYALLEKHDIPLDTGKYFDGTEIEAVRADLPEPLYAPGGTIPNTLSGLAALGAKVGYFGKLADDAPGHVFLDDLNARGITLLNPGFAQTSLSGACIVLLTEGGERSFALHKGCVDDFEESDFDSFDFDQARYFLFPANLLSNTDDPSLFEALMHKIARSSCQIVFSLSEVRDWKGREDLARMAAALSSIFIGNEIENDAYLAITGTLANGKIIVTTRGAKGASARVGQGAETFVAAAPLKKLVSSLGAGDQFLAGFMQGLTMNLPLEQTLALASRCAAAIIEETEARPHPGVSWRSLIEK